ncbi:pyrimidine-nucleoside phosphorylase [Acetomicrobium sp.]|uniref:pyrimidine-nucleoside phosphorylase n=1 Tax=Acetomicrobium sp. TaxID=1872099 RepID=UPI002B25AD58|nr:pyrimidine-nucleoside phosphorylase [Acetomicrobium sp.]
MRVVDIIKKKRDGIALTDDEINFFMKGCSSGDIPDYQIAALLMAIYFRGMNDREVDSFTASMVHSGRVVDLSGIKGVKVDKHSTGGVADTTTLIVCPLVASCGVRVAKMSGRGLGHTGGTLDKLEAIPGMRVHLSLAEFVDIVNAIGISIIGQTEDLVPADKKLYALRDVTATVDSIPLIASSVMSKKIAGGSDAIVLDVKVGEGAFMKDLDDALALAKVMVGIGESFGKRTIAVITDMNQPLGRAIGNSLEVIEACEALKGHGSRELMEVCLTLGSYMLILSGIARSSGEAREMLQDALVTGRGMDKLKEMIKAQGGNVNALEDYSLLPCARIKYELKAQEDCYVSKLEAEKIGMCAMMLGAGRSKKDDKIDHSVGIVLNKKVGDHVGKGETIATVYGNDEGLVEDVLPEVKDAIKTSKQKVPANKLIYAVVKDEGIELL